MVNVPKLQAQPNLGLYLGLNNARLSGDAPKNSKYETNSGLLLGLNVDFKITEEVLLSFQPGYAQAGAKLAYKDSVDNLYQDSLTIDINAFVLPLLFNIISNNKRFYFSSGLEFAYQLESTASSSSNTIELSEELNEINVSVNFGLSYIISIGKPFLFIEARYSQGLINVTDSLIGDSSVPRVKTSGMQLRVGVQLPLTKGVAK
jgi:hypothetical protein